MKKLLLIVAVVCMGLTTVQAKKPNKSTYNIESAKALAAKKGVQLSADYQGETIYLDPETETYLTKKNFIAKYGRAELTKIEEIEQQRKDSEAQAAAKIEQEKTKAKAFEMLTNLNSFESVSYASNKYDSILDALDGKKDGQVDYLEVAIFFRDQIIGVDKNGDISWVNILSAPNLSKEQIYVQANSWFVHTFNSAQSVIQLNDKEAGTILAKGHLSNIAEQIGFANSYEMSANVIFRIDIKDERARLITTIQAYQSIDRGGVASILAGPKRVTHNTCKPTQAYPFINGRGVLSEKAGAKVYIACCMYMIALKNQLLAAINKGINGADMNNW